MAINKVILFGNVGSEPKIATTTNGKKVAAFSLATTDKGYTAKNGTEIPDRTEWHNIVAWGSYANAIEKCIKKGSPLIIEGRLQTREYTDKNGVSKKITEIVVEHLNFTERITTTTNNQQQTSEQQDYQYSNNSQDDDLPF